MQFNWFVTVCGLCSISIFISLVLFLLFLLLGTERQERSSTEAHGEMQNDCCTINSLNSHSTVNSEDNRYSNREGHSSLISEAFSPPNVLRSTFGHMKIIFPANLMELQARNQQIHSSDIYHKEGACLNSKEVLWNNTKKDSIHETIGELCGREMGSYTSNVAVDSFWPLCMYELRGKCNNDECPWQHVKDYCDTILYQNQHDDSDTTGMGFPLLILKPSFFISYTVE